MPCGGMQRFLWNGYSADKFLGCCAAAIEVSGWLLPMAHFAFAASIEAFEELLASSASSPLQESTRSFWLPDWKIN